MKLQSIAFTATLFLAGAPGSTGLPLAATNELTPLGPLGGSIASIVVDPLDPARLLMVWFGSGFVLSTDGGSTIEAFPTTLSTNVDELAQDPNDGQTLYAIDGNSIHKSLDFGATWNALGLVPVDSLKHFAVAPSGGGMLAVDAFNVYRSSDFGATWSTVASVVPFAGTVLDDAIFAPSDPTRAYYSSNKGLFASTDGGVTWFDPGPYDEWVQALTVHPSDPDTVFVGTPFDGVARSTDGGANFIDVTTGPSTGNAEFFAWEPGSNRLWYSLLQGLAYTTDLGQTWIDSTQGLFMTPMPIGLSMAFDSNGRRLWGAETNLIHGTLGGGLYSMDAAASVWEHTGFLSGVIHATAVATPGGRRLVGMESGPQAALPGNELVPTAWSSATYAVAADPDDASRWVVGGVGSFLDNAQILTMTGNGSTATVRYEVFGAGSVQVIEFDPRNSDRVVAGVFPAAFGNRAIVVSTNAGNAWAQIPGTHGWATRDLAFDPHTPERLLQLSDNGQWAESLDSGSTWTNLQPAWPTTASSAFLAFDPHVPGRLFRGEAGMGLWRSDDDGANWTSLGVALHQRADIAFDPVTPGKFWIGNTSGEVLVSLDAGASFTTIATIPGGKPVTGLALDTASGALLVGTDGAAAWELANPTSSPTVYCTAGTSFSGCNAAISATGSPSATASSGFFLNAVNVEGAKDGLFFFGANGRQANAWGNGTSYRCVVPPVKRGTLLVGVGAASACDNSFSQDMNALWCPTCPKPQHNPGSGAVVQAQLWYRDPNNTSNQTTSLSDAIEFLVEP